jgi:Na+/melibiose symporter-like transporter
MNINYNEVDKTIEIKDRLKSHVFLINFLMVLNLLSAILNLSDVKASFGFMKIIWLVIGVVSIVILYYSIFKKSTKEKIPADQIKGLDKRVFLGRKKYFIELKNGKTRDLVEVKSEEDRKQLSEMLRKNGIID